jgi:hypothetical protein
MRKLILLLMSLVIFNLASSDARAGEIAKFNHDFGQAYGVYRQALVATGVGKKDKGAVDSAIKAVNELERQWSSFAGQYKKPPAHFAEEKAWEPTLAKVRALISKGSEAAKRASLDDSHDALEEIRVILGDLRRRNNVIIFSDHVNAYHEQMDEIIGADYAVDGFDAAQRLELIEQLAVLVFLAEAMERNAPPEYSSNPEFVTLLESVFSSIDKVRQSIEENDKRHIINAIAGLKSPFAKLFIKFG